MQVFIMLGYPEFSKYLCRVIKSDSLSPATTPYGPRFAAGSSEAGSTWTISPKVVQCNNHRLL